MDEAPRLLHDKQAGRQRHGQRVAEDVRCLVGELLAPPKGVLLGAPPVHRVRKAITMQIHG